jgi:hypothetical protein
MRANPAHSLDGGGHAIWLLFLLLWMPPGLVEAQFGFATNADGTLTIATYSGEGGDVVIPAVTNGRTVTAIGDGVFSPFYGGAMGQSSVIIPDTVTSIGYGAFEEDQSLTYVRIPNSVTYIGGEAFMECWSLTGSMTIPDAVTSIEPSTFYSCGLSDVRLGTNITVIGGMAFSFSRFTNIIIPNSVTYIGDYAFANCGSLTNVTFSSNLISIGSQMFLGSGLVSATIPSSVTNIVTGAFRGCASLTAINVATNNLAYCSVDGTLFDKNRTILIQYPTAKAGSYALPNSVTDVGSWAFLSSVGLTNVALDTNLTSIGSEAFLASGLISATIPSGVTNIAGGAFAGCTSLTAINVATNNLAYSSVDGVLLDKNRTTILQYPNGKIGNFSIPDTVTSVGNEFEYVSGLTGIRIPDSVTNIATWAFYQCYGLTNVTIGNGVTTIGYNTFSECHNLTWVTLGNRINFFGQAAFEFCENLRGIFFRGDVPQLGLDPFYGDRSEVFYYLPGTTGWNQWVSPPPAVVWNPQPHSFGVRSNQFGFTITGTANIPFVVEARTNLGSGGWTPLQTGNLIDGSIYFGNPQWTNYPAQFYRIRSP